jgi:hypothetical protein
MGRNHGVLTNFSNNGNDAYVTSADRLALAFDGVNDYVDCGNQVPFFPTTHTMAFWCFDRGSGLRFFSYYDNGPTFYRNSASRWAIVSGGSFAWTPTQNIFIAQNVFQHVAYTRNGNDAAFYVNGELRATGSITTTYTATNTVRLGSGTSFGGEPANFIGDDFIIFNTASTPNEIRFIYEQGRGGGMLYQPPRRRSFFATAGFRAYWARRRSQLIGGGL